MNLLKVVTRGMFRGKKEYRFLNRKNSPYNDCIENFLNDEDFVVQFSSHRGKSYIRFSSSDSFYSWYKDVPDHQKSFFEVIRNGYQKFRMDIDENVKDIGLIIRKTTSILKELGFIDPIVLGFDIEKSYHLVLSNYSFPSHSHCKVLASIVSKYVNIDMGVYNKVQHFRVEGSTKYNQRRWKRRMGGVMDANNFHEGIISDTKGTKDVSLPIGMRIGRRISEQHHEGIPESFRIREKMGNLTVLDRERASYCVQCNRSHDHENAYMIGNKFYCRRWTERGF